MKNIYSLIMFCAIIIFTSCQKEDETVSVESVALNKASITIEVGKTEVLAATITPQAVENKEIKWTTSNSSIASVDERGLITALKVGTAVITAISIADNTKKETCAIAVIDRVIAVTSVTLNKIILPLEVGMSEILTATIVPENATNKVVNWTSGDATIATVSEIGLVTALKPGTTTITVTSATDRTKKETCAVTITDAVIAVTDVKLNKNILSLEVGKSEALIAIILPENATNKAVNWTSSDATIATVSETGLVTALKPGATTITATSVVDNTKKETCAVTIATAPKDRFSVGDYYPAGFTKENAVGVVFWIASKEGTKGKIVSMDEATGKDWVQAKSWAENKKDGGVTWTFPTKDELQYLWCAYNGVAPLAWMDGANDNAPVKTDAQATFNSKLTTPLVENYYWSSTEYSIEHAWFVYFGGGDTHFTGKGGETNIRAVSTF